MLHAPAGPVMCLLIPTMHFFIFLRLRLLVLRICTYLVPLYSELDEPLSLIFAVVIFGPT